MKLSEVGADLLFAPSVDEMYPAGFDTTIVVGGPSADLETVFRPQHFKGVATIVAKLLLAGLPDRAYFGEKDYQQLLVVKQLVRDLGIPTEIVGCPTVREPDGLALSSRNAYLSAEERNQAPKLHATMQEAAKRLREGGEPVLAGSARGAHGFRLRDRLSRGAERGDPGAGGGLAAGAAQAARRGKARQDKADRQYRRVGWAKARMRCAHAVPMEDAWARLLCPPYNRPRSARLRRRSGGSSRSAARSPMSRGASSGFR